MVQLSVTEGEVQVFGVILGRHEAGLVTRARTSCLLKAVQLRGRVGSRKTFPDSAKAEPRTSTAIPEIISGFSKPATFYGQP